MFCRSNQCMYVRRPNVKNWISWWDYFVQDFVGEKTFPDHFSLGLYEQLYAAYKTRAFGQLLVNHIANLQVGICDMASAEPSFVFQSRNHIGDSLNFANFSYAKNSVRRPERFCSWSRRHLVDVAYGWGFYGCLHLALYASLVYQANHAESRRIGPPRRIETLVFFGRSNFFH